MKKIILILTLLSSLFLTACMSPNLGPSDEELEKVSLDPTIEYDETKVDAQIKEEIDRKLKPEKEYSIPEENPVFKLKLSNEINVTQENQGNLGNIVVKNEEKVGESLNAKGDFVFSIIPFTEDYSPKAFYYMYSQAYPVELVKIDGMELAMHSQENGEFIAEFIAKDENYYVITIQSKFNIHENIYLINKIKENLEK